MSSEQVTALAGLAVLGFWMLGAYNRLVRLRQGVKAAFALVDVHFRQRHELLARLTAVAAPLTDVPEAVSAVDAARQQARIAADRAAARPVSGEQMASLALAEQVLRSASSNLQTLLKAQPAARADAALREVLEQLSATQHRLAAAHQHFNAGVADYNRNVRQFPTRLIAGMLGFQPAREL